MNLKPHEIALAETCGVLFQPATQAQVQRLSMQRKIFYADGQALVATRGDGLYETVGTLQRLINEAERQQKDLLAWQDSVGEAPAPAAGSVPEETPPLPELASEADPAATVPPEVATKRRGRRRAAPRAEPPAAPAAELPDSTVPVREAPLETSDPHQAANRRSQPGARWRVAGAERRGRAGKHWSTRQR